jgi:hypothetical protein
VKAVFAMDERFEFADRRLPGRRGPNWFLSLDETRRETEVSCKHYTESGPILRWGSFHPAFLLNSREELRPRIRITYSEFGPRTVGSSQGST